MPVVMTLLSAVTPWLSEKMLSASVTTGYSSTLLDANVQAKPKLKNIARPLTAGPTKWTKNQERKNVSWSWGLTSYKNKSFRYSSVIFILNSTAKQACKMSTVAIRNLKKLSTPLFFWNLNFKVSSIPKLFKSWKRFKTKNFQQKDSDHFFKL